MSTNGTATGAGPTTEIAEIAEIVARVREMLKGRVQLFEPPPADFDLLRASDDALLKFGLPRRPNDKFAPEVYRVWAEMLSKPLKIMPPVFTFDPSYQLHLPRASSRGANNAAQAAAGGFRRVESSLNWSGAYITPRRPNRFDMALGSWTIPTPTLPPSIRGKKQPDDGDYRASTWIGIDGHQQYPGASLPQIGTTQQIELADGKRTTTYSAWWQWWAKGQNIFPIVFDQATMPIAAGDRIIATIVVLNERKVLAILKNQTTGHLVTLAPDAPQIPATGKTAGFQVKIRGKSAEWVTERPTRFFSREMYRLPDYGLVTFKDCLAVSSGQGGATPVTQDARDARPIRMYEQRRGPQRTTFVSLPAVSRPLGVRPAPAGATKIRTRYRRRAG
jgi:hypothetical protein